MTRLVAGAKIKQIPLRGNCLHESGSFSMGVARKLQAPKVQAPKVQAPKVQVSKIQPPLV